MAASSNTAGPRSAPSVQKAKPTAGQSTSKNRSTGKKRHSRKSPPDDKKGEESVLSGRMVAAFGLVVAMVVIPLSPLGRVIAKEAPRSTARELWKVGETSTVHLTVTTADYDKLGCADPRVVEGAHCAYESDDERFSERPDAPKDDNKKNILQPYRTTDSQLMLLSGLWAQPAVAMRLHEEPAHGVSDNKLARFVVSCDVKFLEEWDNPKIRWSNRDSWSQQGKAMVAKPLKCEVLDEHQRLRNR